ncbi:MAG: glycosyltransferase [Candidatus Woesearchaeota archaeon]
MFPRLVDYQSIIGKQAVNRIRNKAKSLEGKHVVHVNATALGGGVAEMLHTLVFLMHDVGITTGWRVMFGDRAFFDVTKGIHNALQGQSWSFTKEKKEVYQTFTSRNAFLHHLDTHHDIVIIHDPQPLAMIQHYSHHAKWLWRCHIDITHAHKPVFSYLKQYINQYDGVIVSSEAYKKKEIKVPTRIVYPAIDPRSEKNKPIDAQRILQQHGILTNKPILLQVSRFDPWKGYDDVLRVYEQVQQDCQLVCIGNMASDDPEGPKLFEDFLQKTKQFSNVTVLTENNDHLVNALQQKASVVLQLSKREGFGLTVAESLWKKTPVVATKVGGIPQQIVHGKTGYLVDNVDEAVRKVRYLLRHKQKAKEMGIAGHYYVKEHFLITRLLEDYLDMFHALLPASRF